MMLMLAQQTMGGIATGVQASTAQGSSVAGSCNARLMADLSSRLSHFSYDPESDLTFSKWYDRHSEIFTVEGVALDEKGRVRLLIEKLDSDTFERYKRHVIPKSVWDIKFDDTVKTLKELFDTKVPVYTRRFRCFEIEMNDGEDFMHYVGRVNEQCEIAKVHELDADGFKVLMCLYGMKGRQYTEIRPMLLNWLDEQHAAQKSITLQELYVKVDKLLAYKGEQMRPSASFQVQEITPHQNSKVTHSAENNTGECWNCGKRGHVSNECRAKRWQCGVCQKYGHKEVYCRKRDREHGRVRSRSRERRNVQQRRFTKNVHHVKTEVKNVRGFRKVIVNGHSVEFQLDTGSDITLLSVKEWKSMGEPKLSESDIIARNASGDVIELKGKLRCNFVIGDTKGSGNAYVTSGRSLLGLDWIRQHEGMAHHMDMMTVCQKIESETLVDELKTKYGAVFKEGLGTCKKEKAVLTLKPRVKPVFCAKRKVPYAAIQSVETEIDRLLEMGVIEPVNHSLWAAPIVCVRKANGKIRVCADFSTGLNKALEEYEYPLPIPDDIFASLNGGSVFSQIDFSDAYLQVELDESSQNLAVINTHRGLFKYKRLPFGIKTAPAIFQSIMNKLCAGLRGVTSYLDDVIVVGRNQEEHRENLLALFDRIAEYGFRVRLEKCSFMKEQIPFLGFVVDKNGRHPNPDKIAAIKQMKEPENESQLRAFLGMVTYYGNFVPKMKSLRGPLDKLMRKHQKWTWTNVEQKAFDGLKSVLSSDMNLAHYDPQLPIVVAADACDYGIGAVISHRYPDGTEKPVHHAARSLTTAEKNYSQIEKEGLALVFAVTKFHKYIFGRKFTLLTDHKPLLSIFGSKKGVPVHSANRLMRWATILIGYDFDIQYISTERFGQADGLSRMIQNHPITNEDVVVAGVELDVTNVLVGNIRRLPVTQEDIKIATCRDPILRKVMKSVKSGMWPRNIPEGMKAFHSRKAELSVVDSCLMFADRVVVPVELKNEVMKELHAGHPGIVRMKNLARSLVFWPGLDADCESCVKKCRACQENAKSPVKVPIQSWPTPEKVWERIHVDYAGPIDGVSYLVVVDAKSKWPEMQPVKCTTASNTVLALNDLFIRFGTPETIVSDNGTQFVSREFSEMCDRYGIQHIRTATYHPQSNGQAERFVDILKRGLKKLKGEEKVSKDMLDTVLFSYRTTPCPTLQNKSPAEIFLGRKLRTRLSLLIPRSRGDLVSTDKSVKNLKSFRPGETVFVKCHKGLNWKWKTATVKRRIGKVMYKVLLDGKEQVKHANQMKVYDGEEYTEERTFGRWYEVMSEVFGFGNNEESEDFPLSKENPNAQNDAEVPAPSAAPVPPPRRSSRPRKPVVRFDSSMF